VQLKEESSPHEQDPPAQTPLAAQNVRRRPAIPVIQLSKATIWAGVLAVGAGAALGIGFAQLLRWNAEEMTPTEGQRAIADLIAVAALAVLLALGAMVIWGVSVIVSKLQSADDEAQARHEEARGWAEAHDRLMIEQYAAIAARLIAAEDDRERDLAEVRALALRPHPSLAEIEKKLGRLTHRVEASEAGIVEVRGEADEANGRLDVLELRRGGPGKTTG
jgi:hypothetical protein